MKNLYRFFLSLIIIFTLCPSLYSQYENSDILQSRKVFQKAELSFEQKQYGEALKKLNLAKKMREEEIQQVVSMLESALKPSEIQKLVNNIGQTINALRERNLDEAALIIQNEVSVHGEEYFDYSVLNIVDYYKKKASYPEADLLLAKIFLYEGEYTIAEKLLLQAWNSADILEIPQQKIVILYESANLAKLTGNDDLYEKYLLLIIAEDHQLSVSSDISSLADSMVTAALNAENIDKFFLLYRLQSFDSVSALFQLAKFYNHKKLYDKSQYMSVLSTIASFSLIEQTVKERNLDYVYKNPAALFDSASKHPDILLWADKNNIWEIFYFFAEISEVMGNEVIAEQMYTSLYYHCPDMFWANSSLQKIKNH